MHGQFKAQEEQLFAAFLNSIDAQPQWRCDAATRKHLLAAHAKVNQIMHGVSRFVHERAKDGFRNQLIWIDEFLLVELETRLSRLISEMEVEIAEVETEFGVQLRA